MNRRYRIPLQFSAIDTFLRWAKNGDAPDAPLPINCLAIRMILSCFALVQTATLSLRLSQAERKALRQRARAEGLSQGSLVRRALRAYGVTPEPDKAKTGYDVIKHLIGSCRGGPSDLSTNPKYMEEFGR